MPSAQERSKPTGSTPVISHKPPSTAAYHRIAAASSIARLSASPHRLPVMTRPVHAAARLRPGC